MAVGGSSVCGWEGVLGVSASWAFDKTNRMYGMVLPARFGLSLKPKRERWMVRTSFYLPIPVTGRPFVSE